MFFQYIKQYNLSTFLRTRNHFLFILMTFSFHVCVNSFKVLRIRRMLCNSRCHVAIFTSGLLSYFSFLVERKRGLRVPQTHTHLCIVKYQSFVANHSAGYPLIGQEGPVPCQLRANQPAVVLSLVCHHFSVFLIPNFDSLELATPPPMHPNCIRTWRPFILSPQLLRLSNTPAATSLNIITYPRTC